MSLLNSVKAIILKPIFIYKKIRTHIFLTKFSKKGRNTIIFFPIKVEGKRNVAIGNNVSIGTYVHIWGSGGVTIGNNVLIAAHCCITSAGHDTNSQNMHEAPIYKSVKIEDNVWLGYNVTILPGVCVGEGSVVGAGSVVTSSIPPNSIVVGNPARVIKQRFV